MSLPELSGSFKQQKTAASIRDKWFKFCSAHEDIPKCKEHLEGLFPHQTAAEIWIESRFQFDALGKSLIKESKQEALKELWG